MAEAGEDDRDERDPGEDPGQSQLRVVKPRVTLDFSGPPLRLPGEEEEDEGRRDSQPDLLLPEALRPPAHPGEEALRPVHDAWVAGREEPVEGGGTRSAPLLDLAAGASSSRPPGLRSIPAPRAPKRRAPSTDAIELVEQSHSQRPGPDLAEEMAERFALGDFTGALTIAELVLGKSPDDEVARRYADGSRERLAQLYTSRIGRLDRVPHVAVPDSEIRWLGLDHQAAFLLSRVDGQSTVEELLHVVAMPRLDALKTLVELLDAGAVELGG